MLDRLRSLLLEPRHPHRYVGRHRADRDTPVVSLSFSRTGRAPA